MKAVLTGFMGSGKSSIGRELQTLLGCSFGDLDEIVERREGRTVRELFAGGGEEAFRKAELEALRSLAWDDDMILALGGGTLMQKEAGQLLQGVTKIYLRTSGEELVARLEGCAETRPMLHEKSIHELLEARIPVYEQTADITADTDGRTPWEIAVDIARKLGYGRFVECCCGSAVEAVEAKAGGASRVELCEQLEIGGVTPSESNIASVLAAVDIPVNVLVRPRGGDFVWSEDEMEEMLSSIRMCKAMGVNAVVIGALRGDGSIDTEAMERLISEARPMPVTFHRAFDECACPLESFDDILALGCDRLLTSGHEADACTGRRLIGELVHKAEGRITVMAGCGVRPGNIGTIERDAHAPEFHSSAHGPSGMTDRHTVAQLVFGN